MSIAFQLGPELGRIAELLFIAKAVMKPECQGSVIQVILWQIEEMGFDAQSLSVKRRPAAYVAHAKDRLTMKIGGNDIHASFRL